MREKGSKTGGREIEGRMEQGGGISKQGGSKGRKEDGWRARDRKGSKEGGREERGREEGKNEKRKEEEPKEGGRKEGRLDGRREKK